MTFMWPLMTWLVDPWPEVYVIWTMNDLCLCIMKIWWITWFHKMAPGWRHDDLVTLKKLIWLEIIGLDDWQKFEGNWPCWFRVNVWTKKCTEEIKTRHLIRHGDELGGLFSILWSLKSQKRKKNEEINCWRLPDSNQGSRGPKSSALPIYQNISHSDYT